MYSFSKALFASDTAFHETGRSKVWNGRFVTQFIVLTKCKEGPKWAWV
jgi:hypothetical protein